MPQSNSVVPFDDPRESVKSTALSFPARAEALVVRDQAGLDEANRILLDARAMTEKIQASFGPQIKKAHDLHKSILAEQKRFLDPIERASAIIRPKVANYLAEQDRLRLEAARLRQLAEEKAAKIAEQTTDKAQEAIKSGNVKKADAMIERGFDKVNEVLASAPDVPPVPVANASLRVVWEFEITDEKLIPREYLLVDRSMIGAVVRAKKDQTSIPGVRAYPKNTIAVRGEKL